MAPLNLPLYNARCMAHDEEIEMVTTLLICLTLPPLISVVEVTSSSMKRGKE